MSTVVQNIGRVVQVIGPVIDVEFEPDKMPAIYNALKVSTETEAGQIELIAEVQQHLPGSRARAVGMSSTDGLVRGTEVIDTGMPITMPVGKETLGRIFNVLGETVDHGAPIETKERYPIHREAPSFDSLEPTTEIFETGIKVIDL